MSLDLASKRRSATGLTAAAVARHVPQGTPTVSEMLARHAALAAHAAGDVRRIYALNCALYAWLTSTLAPSVETYDELLGG